MLTFEDTVSLLESCRSVLYTFRLPISSFFARGDSPILLIPWIQDVDYDRKRGSERARIE